jgi:hypothetical protein
MGLSACTQTSKWTNAFDGNCQELMDKTLSTYQVLDSIEMTGNRGYTPANSPEEKLSYVTSHGFNSLEEYLEPFQEYKSYINGLNSTLPIYDEYLGRIDQNLDQYLSLERWNEQSGWIKDYGQKLAYGFTQLHEICVEGQPRDKTVDIGPWTND